VAAEPLAPHPGAGYEYWFFKLNAGPVALLVDWVIRRRERRAFVRVSSHAPGFRSVQFLDVEAADVLEAASRLPAVTAGRVGDTTWALEAEVIDGWIAPDVFPARALQMADVSLVSAPQVAFRGRVEVGDHQESPAGARGMIAHYWGRQLPTAWWWISAQPQDRPDFAVEAAVLRTALWGGPLHMRMAYLYCREGAARRLWTSPPHRSLVAGSAAAFEIKFAGLSGAPVRVRARGRDYADLGDGIVNTLVGDLEVWEGRRLWARADGCAALELRGSQGRDVDVGEDSLRPYHSA